jgi:hypothetical protein
VTLTIDPAHISHLVLIGTTLPVPPVKMAKRLFYDTAPRAVNDFEDIVTLFFKPKSARSHAAAARSRRSMILTALLYLLITFLLARFGVSL